MKNKKALPVIFTILGSVGVLATGYFSARAAHKSEPTDDKKEYVKKNWKNYILPTAVAAGTIGCVAVSQILNDKQKVAMVAAIGLSGASSINAYREEVRKELGKEKEAELYSNSLQNHALAAHNFLLLPAEEDKTQLFYDEVTERYFWSNETKVLEAIYHLNRNFSGRGTATVNEYCSFLDLIPVEGGDISGWDWESIMNWGEEVCWIDFFIRDKSPTGEKLIDDAGREYLKITPVYTPDVLSYEYL